jgi:hypothetical protein
MWSTIKAAASSALQIASKVPVSGIVKAAVFVGVCAFTVWVMIRHTKKVHEESGEEGQENRSIVDEILGKSYATDPDAYDDMDPEARRICKKLNKTRKKGKKKGKKVTPKKKENYRTVSLFEKDYDDDEEEDRPPPRFFKNADEMLFYDEQRRKAAKPRKKRKVKIDKEHASQLKQLIKEWKEAGCVDDETFKRRLDSIARDLGYSVRDLDDAVSDSTRDDAPLLF